MRKIIKFLKSVWTGKYGDSILSRKERRARSFHGYDVSELAECWGLMNAHPWDRRGHTDNAATGFLDEDYIVSAMKEHLNSLGWLERGWAVMDMKRFILQLAANDATSRPVYEGLAQVDDDAVFVSIFMALAHRMSW